MLSKKVIITGSFGVGKTSLFNQFIFNRFSDKYLTTIGVKVNKKTLNISGQELSMLLWDVAGEVSQDKVPKSYFLGSSGIIYVFDLSRPSTYKNIGKDIAYLKDLVPGASLRIVGNKLDLVTKEELENIKTIISEPWNILTCAKTGENVESLFMNLGSELLLEVTN